MPDDKRTENTKVATTVNHLICFIILICAQPQTKWRTETSRSDFMRIRGSPVAAFFLQILRRVAAQMLSVG
jgi:hypothetical protein